MLKNIWNNYKINLNSILLSKDVLKNTINLFWKDIVKSDDDNKNILLLFRIQFNNHQFRTLGKLKRLNLNEKELLIQDLFESMKDRSDFYYEESIISIQIDYQIKNGQITNNLNINQKDNQLIKYQNINHHKLPITINPLEYGNLIKQFNNNYIIGVNETNLALITVEDGFNKVQFFRNNNLRYEYIDRIINDSTFVRELGNRKFTFINNELMLTQINKKVKFIKSINQEKELKNKFLTMDIETFINKENVHIPYAISIFDGISANSFYLTDFKSSNEMLIEAISSIMIKKYDNFKVYLHNFSKFDAIFLLKILCKIGTIKPIIHDGRIISIQFKFKDYIIHFRDSYLLLPASLLNLGISFKVEIIKSLFPYKFVKETNLNYIGKVPNIIYFDGISNENYNEYLIDFIIKAWNLKDETINYCNNDCKSLYQIIIKFNEIIFKLFKLNIHNYPTLPSLSFAIFRSNYMKENQIAQLSDKIAEDIRLSYTGGSTDMYIPSSNNKTLYWYDINSLYPSIMKDNLMPIGAPTYFEGNIRNIDPNAFGFFYCEITTPEYLEHPIIQTHVKTNNGLRTISPLGEWSDMIFSEEMDNAIKYGYKFNILWGYTFEKGNIFGKYVDDQYQLRLNYPKEDPMNLTGKLLSNSLYGRFGMDDNFANITIFDNNETYQQFENKNAESIINILELDNKILVQHRNFENELNQMLDNGSETHNVNIAIASAISSYSRIHMSQFKNNPNYKLFYSDTDSLFTNKPLDESLVSKTELGKMKLEAILKKAIFLSPKVYCLETIDNKIIYKVKGLDHNIKLEFYWLFF